MSQTRDEFQLRWRGNTLIITPSSGVEHLNNDLIRQAASVLLDPVREIPAPMVIIDLSELGFFGSQFLGLLMQCHKFIKAREGELVICGASELSREVFKVTQIDRRLTIYDTLDQALDALAT